MDYIFSNSDFLLLYSHCDNRALQAWAFLATVSTVILYFLGRTNKEIVVQQTLDIKDLQSISKALRTGGFDPVAICTMIAPTIANLQQGIKAERLKDRKTEAWKANLAAEKAAKESRGYSRDTEINNEFDIVTLKKGDIEQPKSLKKGSKLQVIQGSTQ